MQGRNRDKDVEGKKIHNSTIIFGDFSTPLSIINRTIRQKINKEIEDLNNTVNQLDLTDIYRKPEYTFFSGAYGTFSRINHMLGHKTNLDKFKETDNSFMTME